MISKSWLNNLLVRRALFIGVTLSLVFLIFTAIVLPLQDYLSAGKAEIERKTEILARLKGIAAYKPEKAGASDVTQGADEYLTGPNEGVATANLQVRLKAVAQKSGTRLKSVQGLPAEMDGQLRMIGVRLEIIGPIQAIYRTILSIEGSRPYLFIRSAAMRLSRQARNSVNRPPEPILEAQLEVIGAFRAGGEP